jgi:hypothetical protein
LLTESFRFLILEWKSVRDLSDFQLRQFGSVASESLPGIFGRDFIGQFMKIHDLRPNTALEPTPRTPRVCRFEFLVFGCHQWRGSAFGR